MISYQSAMLGSGPVVTLRDDTWFHGWRETGFLRTRCKVSLLCKNCARLRRECARRETLVRFPRAWMVSERCPAAEPRSVSTVDVVCLRRFVWIATRAWCRFFPSRISSWMDQGSRWTSYLKMRESRVAAGLSEDNTVARGGAVCNNPALARTSPDTRWSCGRTERQHQKAPRRHHSWCMRGYLKLARGEKTDVAASRSSPKLH